MASTPLHLLLYGVLALAAGARAAGTQNVDWSSKTYGPDGPWQAVQMQLGSQEQDVDLYPGASWASNILLSNVCSNTTTSKTCYAQRAGAFNVSASNTNTNYLEGESDWTAVNWNVAGESKQGVLGDYMKFGPIVPNVSMTATYDTYQTYPNGKAYPVEVGTLALGAPKLKHIPDISSGEEMNMIASYLYTDGGANKIPSYSFGMHIGSVKENIPGSLVLGGYDQNRVVGDVSSQKVALPNGEFEIQMKDIGLGVATGGSPWNFTRKDNMLPSPAHVQVDPTRPYLYLPKSTCDSIATWLPVTYNESLGLYFWNESDSQYKDITSSAAYLSFSFYANNSGSYNTTIKVPFKLLDLTLQEPLVAQNTSYFPCFASDDNTYILGRAFLQAAFLGANYVKGNNEGYWFLAQAPGPSYSIPSPENINVEDQYIGKSGYTFEGTWDGHWNGLAADESEASKPSSGLSSGAKAGIGVGVAVAGVILIGAFAWVMILRRRRGQQGQPTLVPEKDPGSMGPGGTLVSQDRIPHHIPTELENLDARQPHDIQSSSVSPRYELHP
ncbi:hypothetical protein ASPWEDRAFT_45330 [Aspergillus wentii DTO 134E9]|uniref:Peptidase A1 domain-containing protein n=1 Tax=Aspergillus wentii DTO 134E9 TaxID=1073089 RepID=A0A1L9R8Z4_ASPWE|nr:uncharacterized protein ASPWEDRAFT_45330 [Aspergillus wentii DTO 134E9]OJJ31392.1 hypothetical protein ASPWEDRAFT_45330 [Aspergillus wentii DTO 134E9]